MPLRLSASAVLATALMVPALSAHALTSSVTNTAYSTQAGANTITFGSSTVNNGAAVAGSAVANDVVYAGSAGGVTYSYTDGALFNNTDLISGVAARPVGAVDNYYSLGNAGLQTGTGAVSFSTGLSYFGFLWGSPDTYNTVTFWNGNTQLASFDGSIVKQPADGNQSYARYFNVFTQGSEKITRVTFASNGNAFETDNHAFITAVPEPETYAMLLAGLGLMGVVARRKNKTRA